MPRPPNPETRTRLLALGADLIRSRGFAATGVQEITGAAEVPKGSFYNYFDSKDAFAVASLDAYWTTIVDLYCDILQDATIPPRQRIERYFAGLTAFHRERGFTVGCLIGNLALEVANTSEEIRLKLLGIFAAWTLALADCLREAQAQGGIPADKDPDQIARALIEGFEGAVMRAKVERNATPFERFSTLVLPSLLA